MSRDILGLLLLILSVLIVFMFVSPQLQELHTITVEEVAKSKVAQAKQQRIQALQQVKTIFDQQQDRVDRLISAVPPTPQVPELLVSVEAMARESGLALTSYVPQVNNKDKVVYVAIVGEGQIAGVEKFAELVAANNRPMSVSSLSLQRNQDGTRITFTTTLRVPYADDSKGTSL